MLLRLKNLGVLNVKINELQGEPGFYVSFEQIMHVRYRSPFAHGCSTYIPIMPGMKVLLKRSCFVTEESRKASVWDLCKIILRAIFPKSKHRFAVLYEDGTLTPSWRGEGDCAD